MSTITISNAGAHASAETTDRIPASKAGVKGYLTNSQIGTLFGLTASGQTVVTSSPVANLAQTWNAGAVTFTGLKFNVTDTASASASLLMDLQVGGVSMLNVTKLGTLVTQNSLAAYGSGIYMRSDTGGYFLGASDDIALRRDAANTLAQRNGVNAQAFRIYNTYTDASNYERFKIDWTSSSNVIRLFAEAAGTGTQRNMDIGATAIRFFTGSSLTQSWTMNSSGHLTLATDGTYDIGTVGATRPRSGYFSSKVSAAYIADTGGTNRLDFSTANIVGIYGSSASYPGLKRSGTDLIVRLADDSGNASLTALNLSASASVDAAGRVTAYNATAIPAGGTTGSGIKLSSATNFGVFFGSGAPTLSAAKGSLYLRSDGSGTADRMYVNTDGGTTWTAVATVA